VATQNRKFDGGQTAQFDDSKLPAVCLAAPLIVTYTTSLTPPSRALNALRNQPLMLNSEESFCPYALSPSTMLDLVNGGRRLGAGQQYV
jgi:hypothetical protein